MGAAVFEWLGFEPWSRHSNFRDWVSPASKMYMTERLLKRHKSSKQPNYTVFLNKGLFLYPQAFKIYSLIKYMCMFN